MIKYLLLCLFFFSVVFSIGQPKSDSIYYYNRKFTVTQLKADLKELKDSLEIIHPALYRHISKKKFDEAFKRADQLIDKPKTQAEFYSIIVPLITLVGDIHSTIEIPDETFNYLATETILLPFDVRIINNQVFIASNNSSDTSIPVGARVLSIDVKPIDQIITDMASCFSDEGKNKTLKLKRVEQRFAFQYHLTQGYSEKFLLEYSANNNASVTKTVEALPFTTIRQNRLKNQEKYPGLKSLFPTPPYLLLSVDENKSLAILTIKWLQNDVLEASDEKFKTFVDSSFAEIRSKKIDNLIIDIRNNGGGESENASYLYSYISKTAFRFLYAMETNQKTYEADLKKGVKYKPLKSNGKYQTFDSTTNNPQFFGLNLQQPMQNVYSGKLFVLIDGLTVSAAAQFASLVRLNKRGLLIGEDAPGSLNGGSGRGYSYFLLPNSGLLVMISQYRLYLSPPDKIEKDLLLTADYKPEKTFNDLLIGADKDLEFVLRAIDPPKMKK